jgi:hypothetical protein
MSLVITISNALDGDVHEILYTDEKLEDILHAINVSLAVFETKEELDYANAVADEPQDDMTDVEADADTLKSAGMGTDEDYGYYPEE